MNYTVVYFPVKMKHDLDKAKISCTVGNKEYCFWHGKKAENVLIFLIFCLPLDSVEKLSLDSTGKHWLLSNIVLPNKMSNFGVTKVYSSSLLCKDNNQFRNRI